MRPERDIELTDAEIRDLVALADGSLPEERRAEVEARIEADPRLRASYEEQLRAVDAVRRASAETEAPSSLRHRIDEQSRRGAPAKRRRWAVLGGFAVTAATAALVVALVLPTTDPSVAEAADLSAKPPADAAPPPDPKTPALLAEEIDGVRYPNWDKALGWKASGGREDELDGRDAKTVYYDNDEGKRVGYTIVAGERIDPPEDSKLVEKDGEKYWTFKDDGRNAVVWYRDGRTCVMTGEDVPDDVLVKLASWEGKGAVKS